MVRPLQPLTRAQRERLRVARKATLAMARMAMVGGEPSYYDYFVDSVAGADTNSGRGPRHALKTLGALPTITNGMRIGLAAGSYFEEMLSLAGTTGVLVGAYNYVRGVSTMPRIDTTALLDNEDFTPTEGQANTYQIAVTHALTSAQARLRIFRNGVPLGWQTSIANVNSNAGTCFYSGNANGANPLTIYMHAPGSVDPTSDGAEYRVAVRDMGVVVGTDTIVRDIYLDHSAHDNGLVSTLGSSPNGGRLEYCILRWGTKHHAVLRPDAGHDAAFVGVCCYEQVGDVSQWSGGATALTFNTATPAGGNMTWEGCVVDGESAPGVAPNPIYSHTSGSGAYGQCLVKDNYFRKTAKAIDFGSGVTSSPEIKDNFLDGCTGVLIDIFGVPLVIAGLTVINAPTNYRLAYFETAGGAVSLTDVCLHASANPSGGVIFGNSTIEYTATLSHLTVQATSGASCFSDDAESVATIHDCVLQGTNAFNLQGADPITADRNVYFRSGGTMTFTTNGDTVKTGLAAWQAASGEDANSVESNPLFAGNLAEGDFSLQAGSPAFTGGRDAGARRWRTQPDWAALRALWDQYIYAHPTDAVGGSQLVRR